MTIAECLQAALQLEAVSDTPRLDLELLLSKVLEKDRSYLYTWPERSLTPAQEERFTELLQRRMGGEPVAYLLGEKEFWSLPLLVNRAALIPRPETELLVETALELLSPSAKKVLDLGTGTGAIALALASERPHWDILAVDKSPAAVGLAIENCRRLGLTNVAVNRGDWYRNLSGELFDLIVSNPPYVDPQDPHLDQGDVRFEPRSALVAEDHGLADIRRIIIEGRDYLRRGGWLLVEHGWDQGERVRRCFVEAAYLEVETRRDLSGNDRITLGRR